MTTQPRAAGRATRAKDPSSPSDTAAQKEQAVRLVGQSAAETGKEAGVVHPGFLETPYLGFLPR